MAENLEDKLVKIEQKLGGSGDVPPIRDLGWHLDTIESLIGEGGFGSGKLYEYSFDLYVYDDKNTNPEANKLQLLIYESNFERIKSIVAQAGLTVNTPQDIVTIINSFSEASASTDDSTFMKLTLLAAAADQLIWIFNGLPLQATVDVLGISIVPLGQVTSGLFLIPLGLDAPYTYYGLNTKNSCTFKEYEASAAGNNSSSSITQTIQLKKKLIKISAKKTVHGDGDNQKYDYDLTYDFYKKISKKEEEEFLADIKQQMPDVTSLQEAIDAFITNNISQLPEEQQSSTFALLAYAFGFDYVETGYFEYNHTDNNGFYMAEPWVAKGPLFCYMGDTNYEYKMSMVGIFGGNPTQIKPSGTWTTSVTDVIEDEFTIQGKQSSGTSTDVLKNYKEILTFYSQNGSKICDLSKILALKTEEWYYGLLNNGFQDIANTLSLTIPTITNASTVQNGINTILSALHQAGASSDIPAFVVSFATDFDFVIKQKVSNAGNETYPLFITWDASAYIMEAGSFVDLFTKFDFTGAYTVSYSLTEVNVTD